MTVPAVRAGRSADGPRLREIQRAALAAPWPEILNLALEDDGPLLSVVETDRPVGYAVALVTEDPLAYVPEFAVAPDEHGQGYGSLLLRDLLSTLHDAGVERVRLTARAGDHDARQFYARRGFAVVDRVADHFDTQDGVVYERRIGTAEK